MGLGDEQPEQVERTQLLPQVDRVADRVVLHLAHDGRRRVLGEQAAHDLAEHLLLLGEGEIKHVVRPLRQGTHWSPERRQGLSSGAVGRAMRTVAVVHRRSFAGAHLDGDGRPAAAGGVGLDGGDGAGERHRLAGVDRVAHAEVQATRAAERAGPVGDEPLEPGLLVGGVEEDVAGAVALDGEVAVVVHRAASRGSPAPRARRWWR